MPQYSETQDSKGMAKERVFVICPVRRPKIGFLRMVFQKFFNLLFDAADQWTKNQKTIGAYVAQLEARGYDVYWPTRDNPHQKTDKIGITICEYNREKMFWAHEVHIWYDKNSMGSIFDIGMFLMFTLAIGFKKFIIINPEDIAPTPHKSFENVVLALAKEFDKPMVKIVNGLKEKWAKYGK